MQFKTAGLFTKTKSCKGREYHFRNRKGMEGKENIGNRFLFLFPVWHVATSIN